MAKWETLIFMMNRGRKGEQIISAPVYKGLALVRTKTKQTWSLTHVRSGLRIMMMAGERKDVRRLAATIADMIDWTAFDNAEEITKAHPTIGEKITAIADFEESGGATAGTA